MHDICLHFEDARLADENECFAAKAQAVFELRRSSLDSDERTLLQPMLLIFTRPRMRRLPKAMGIKVKTGKFVVLIDSIDFLFGGHHASRFSCDPS
jgi:hypothetical protein